MCNSSKGSLGTKPRKAQPNQTKPFTAAARTGSLAQGRQRGGEASHSRPRGGGIPESPVPSKPESYSGVVLCMGAMSLDLGRAQQGQKDLGLHGVGASAGVSRGRSRLVHLVAGPLAQTSPGRPSTILSTPVCLCVAAWACSQHGGASESRCHTRTQRKCAIRLRPRFRSHMAFLLQTVLLEAVLKGCSVSEGEGELDGGKVLEEHTELEIPLWPSLASATPMSTEGTPCPTSACPRQVPCLSAELPPSKEPGSDSRKPSQYPSVT